MERNENIHQALESCYDAVLTPEAWPDALHKLAHSLDSACAMFYLRDEVGAFLSVPASHDYHEFLQEYVRHRWYLDHYRADRGFPLLDAGRPVVVEHQLATDDERKTLRHYNDLYLRWGFPWFAMAGFKVADQRWCVPLLRRAGQGPFTREDADEIARLIPYFRSLISLTAKIAHIQGHSALRMLEGFECGAFLLNWRGEVLEFNAKAEALLGEELRVRDRRLTASNQNVDRRLRQSVASAAAARSATDFEPLPVAVPRHGGRPLLIETVPAVGLLADVFRHVRVILFVTDPDEKPQGREAILVHMFKLTAAEARLAALLGAGESLDGAANALEISRETARSQLKGVFAKTDTHRQSELVALLVRLFSPRPASRLNG